MNTITPNEENTDLIRRARQSLGGMPFLGVHIRRGDHKSVSWRYGGGHVPSEDYVRATMDAWSRGRPDLNANGRIWVASDANAAIGQFAEMLPENLEPLSLHSGSDERLKALSPSKPYNQSTWNVIPAEARVLETRGVIVDFALFSGAWSRETERTPEAVICAIT